LQRISVEALELEADHWVTIADIKLRRNDEQKDLQRLVKDFEFRFRQIPKCVPAGSAFEQEKITATFSKAQKEVDKWRKAVVAVASETPSRVLPNEENECKITDGEDPRKETGLPKEDLIAYIFETLHSAAALAARGDTPRQLAQLRLAHQEHAYSIRQSAIFARGYELAVSSGTKRLLRFYASGLRPEKVAQLIYAAATVAIPAVIAGK
jgi:hypothetical protein